MPGRKYEKTMSEALEWANGWPSVRRWLGKLQRKGVRAQYLWLFCDWAKLDPDELLALKSDFNDHKAEVLLDEFVSDESIEYPNSVKWNCINAVKSFFRENYKDLARACGKIYLKKVKPWRKPTKRDLLKFYKAARNSRDRSLITFVYSTAIARETVSKLKWSHLEPNWETKEIPHISIPDALIKGHGLGKFKGVRQETFLTPEAKRDLIEYREWMERRGYKFTPDSAIYMKVNKPFKPLSYKELGKVAFRLSKWAGIPFSWHDGRRYVQTALEEVRMNPNWTRKIRGRKVRGEEAPYSRPAVEQLRNAYREAVPYLEFTGVVERVEMDSLLSDIEEISRLPGGREFWRSVVKDAKARLTEMLEKQRS